MTERLICIPTEMTERHTKLQKTAFSYVVFDIKAARKLNTYIRNTSKPDFSYVGFGNLTARKPKNYRRNLGFFNSRMSATNNSDDFRMSATNKDDKARLQSKKHKKGAVAKVK